jgi:uncharacterized membrane protein YfcA
VSPVALVLATVVVLLGSAIQGSVGFGFSLLAAPLLVLVDPGLVPGPMILPSFFLNLLVMQREQVPGAWKATTWPGIGQVPGAVAGAAILALVAEDRLTVFFAALILVAVGLSVSGLHPRRTPATLLGAGVLSGFMGTAVGIGGPPLALLYQRATGPEIRAAMSRFFLLASVTSIIMLRAFDRFDGGDLIEGLLLVPGALVGYLVSGQLAGRLDRRRMRIAVLTLSAASAIVALLRGLF